MTPEQEQELIRKFDILFDQISPPESQEEIDETLREAGYDPDEVADSVRDLARQHFEQE